MKQIRLTKSDEGLDVLEAWYAKFYESLPVPTRVQRVETSFGYTEVVFTGPDEGPVIVLLHGAAAGAPFVLYELGELAGRMRFAAVNIPGQSTHASPMRLSFKGDEYGRWLVDVLDALELESPVIGAVSWGASVALRLCHCAPERVGGLVLVVPGSIVAGPIVQGFLKTGWPMLRYGLRPTEANRDRALEAMFTNHDPMWTPYLGDVLRLFNTDFTIPPLAKPVQLERLRANVFVIAAENDLSFPGVPLLERAKELFPNLVGTHLVEGARHVLSFKDEDRRAFAELFERAVQDVTPAP